ncbi:MAG: short-chain dehydrogenase [Bacteroidetes bacterium]|nr:short-chain dehydrogenase [Bacteroidota bacterium]
MTTEQIERFVGTDADSSARIFFKTRSTFEGMFIKAPDYAELKKKNFWRIVAAHRMEEYRRSKDINLSRIFNGGEFVRLASNS